MPPNLPRMNSGVKGALRAHPVQASVRKGERPRLHAAGRRCLCGNPISIYNGSVRCHACILEMNKDRFVGFRSLREIMEEED